MNVKQLIEKLQELPQDLEVALYLSNIEEGGSPYSVKVIGEDDCPYFKGDNWWSLGIAGHDEKLAVIKG